MDSTLDELLKSCPACQKRTGKGKRFVFIKEGEIWKGPYNKRLINKVTKRSKILRNWETPFIVHPIRVEGEWIIFPNVAKDYPIPDILEHKESFSRYEYQVAGRGIVDKLNNVIDQNRWVYESADLIEALVHLWILEVGDTGMFNILVDQQEEKLYVIDYEEDASSIRENEIFYFSKSPAGKFDWYENTMRHYNTVAKRLERLKDVSPEFKEKISKAIDLLNKYGGEETGVAEERNTRGSMKWGGMFGGTTTYSGYKLDVIKSGLQKYIRRGETEKAVKCAIEIYRLGEVGGTAAVSNLMNRLKIISVEDVGLAEYNKVLAVLNIINKGVEGPGYVKAIVQVLSSGKKTRLGSHLYATYANQNNRKYAESIGIVIESDFSDEDLQMMEELDNDPMFNIIKDDTLRGYAIMVFDRLRKQDFNAITWLWHFQGYTTLNDIKIVMTTAYHDGTKNRKTSKPIIVIFNIIATFIGDEATNILKHAFFTITENKPTAKNPYPRNDSKFIILFGIMAALFNLKYRRLLIRESVKGLDHLMKGNYTLEIDDYVIDKHTSEGSRKGKSRKEFVSEGAVVIPEDMTYHYDNLYDVYIHQK